MTDKERIFMDVILAIEGKRFDVWNSSAAAVDALDELEEDIRDIAKSHGCPIPEPRA